MKKGIVVCIAIVLLLMGCAKGSPEASMSFEERQREAEKLDSRLADETNKLGLKLFSQLREDDNGIVTLSPYSISAALALAYNGSDGNTAAELGELLGYKQADIPELNADHLAMLRLLENAGVGIELNIANSIWSGKGTPLRDEYIRASKDNYEAEIHTTDLAGAQSVKEINKWVSDATKQKIETMLVDPPGRDAVAVLVNALYFKGGWESEFKEKDTKKEEFYTSEGQVVQVDMMRQHESFSYAENEKWQAIRLPYGEGQMDMLVILPSSDSSLSELQEQLLKEGVPTETGFSHKNGEIRLPRFKSSYGTDLKKAMKVLGVKLAFDPRQSNFSKMADSPDPVYISQIIHKTFIDVYEKGTEAAASTLVGMDAGSAPEEPFQMVVNRPFFFAIEDRQTGLWLFIGAIGNPQKEE